MKIPFQILGPSLALVIVLISNLPAMGKEVHTGKIVFAGDSKLVISDADEVNEVFVVAEDAKITGNGQAAQLSDLATGDAVQVTATRKNGKLTATSINARTDK